MAGGNLGPFFKSPSQYQPATDGTLLWSKVLVAATGQGVVGATAMVNDGNSQLSVTGVGQTRLESSVRLPWHSTSIRLADAPDTYSGLVVENGGSYIGSEYWFEGWFYFQAANVRWHQSLISTRVQANGWELYYVDGSLRGHNMTVPAGLLAEQNKWVHIGYGRAGGVTYLFRNGVLLGAATSADLPTNGSGNMMFGGSTGYPHGIHGYCSDVLYMVGACRYTSDFPTPIGPYGL